MERQSSWEIYPLDYEVFIGLDVDKKSMAVTSFNHKEQLNSVKMPNNAEKLINYTRKRYAGKKVAFAYEVGPTGYGLYDELNKSGYECLVVNPSSVPIASGRKVKTNRLDSIQIAKGLRGGELKSVRVPETKYRDLRHLIQLYDTVVKGSRANKCRIKALLLMEGISYPGAIGSDWSNNTIEELGKIDCREMVRIKLDLLLEDLKFQIEKKKKINLEIRRYCETDKDLSESVEYLISIPGIGRTIAVHLLAKTGDWRNLKNVRELGSFIGLTPSERSTGEDINKGRITHAGDARLRNMLVEGAWTAIRKDPELTEFYNRIYKRHPIKVAARKAIIAVARKMTGRIYRVLKDRRKYVVREVSEEIRFNKKRRHCAPKDDSTYRRTCKQLQVR